MVLGTDLTGKMAVVTGAGGILCGMFARTLARAGAAVALLDINLEAAEETARDIREAGGTAAAYGVDVMDKEMLESVHARVLARLGPCDILINGAGGNQAGANTSKEYFEMGDIEADVATFFDMEYKGVQGVLDLNFLGGFLTCQVFAKDMVDGRDAISSTSPLPARPGPLPEYLYTAGPWPRSAISPNGWPCILQKPESGSMPLLRASL